MQELIISPLNQCLTTSVADTAANIYTTDETVNGISSFLYFKLKFKPITVKAQATMAQLSENLTMLGGYAVNEIIDTSKKYRRLYTNERFIDLDRYSFKWS